MTTAIRKISDQRVNMRREMFRGAMTAEETTAYVETAERAFASGDVDLDAGLSKPA